ncbi:MAG TPA: hypothetical protein VGO43_13845 [Pyrinomonadaceae bacterium]|jgi:hypothetical protein|nr:hypothetical protein [Pyrinomonadaceae bacterium]
MKKLCLVLSTLIFSALSSCSTAESPNAVAANAANAAAVIANAAVVNANAAAANGGATIEITAGGPADTVRAFYTKLREKKFREAIFLTNLRPAVEGLTDTELQDFSLDFEAIAGQVPPQIEINGEIISGELATVTLKLPGDDPGKKELQQLKLRKEGNNWVILSIDKAAEAKIKKEGKRYFYALRIETHQDEARKMMDRVSKAELVYSLQNGGVYTDIPTLVAAGLLPDDIQTSASTGYNYAVNVLSDSRSYFVTAVPAEYGKSGKLSFLLELDSKGGSRLTSKENGGKPMKK